MKFAALLAAALLLPPTPPHAGLAMHGADVSTLPRAQDLGAKYYDRHGHRADPYEILQRSGVNYVRLRIWNNPTSGYNNRAEVVAQAREARRHGLKVLIDFHYSDTWADPGKQFIPAAWAGHDLEQLQKDVYDYTYDVCRATRPDSVQIGNEINTGLLWPAGQVDDSDFGPLASLLKAGYTAAKACDPRTRVLIHTADAGSIDAAHWFYDGIAAQGVRWDVTALSYYCMWHGDLTNLASVLNDLRDRYGRPTVIAETAYPFTTDNHDHLANIITSAAPCDGIPASPRGQAEQLRRVQDVVRKAGGLGVFYWEPTWTAVDGNGWDPEDIQHSGDAWENMATFDFHGRINPYIRF
ncbi:arabinogalactan endo-1,4-beta-galactosidase [Actinoplanes sp. SE50]|uniref:glycoside hydrolase family 53 protein n=1 Tax=unclassified Actinoplanes TaxID=2626549 RepID=UPI00023EBF89|nr:MULTISPECIES: glycosyl hydrolase 53 family protein [unclassified Actinoplanes]AEV86316.1 arabinogalactan endo-1, 4-beta-galactosidase [Actinoplanes sp. SE50/110]ATO84713.1 arabinogalactan endo-1,4-beta-galactosidase [Actinoplanes sp. SE50]SLM02123.1 arabinogalactan endo-1,4-beta-galactosidase [Actinoplanes sp. SE50/110]